jgi:ubiquinone biosynthesis protein
MAAVTEINYGELAQKVEAPPPKPTADELRFLRAYLTTFEVIFSYLWLFFLKRVRGQAYFMAVFDDVNRRNARRVQRTLSALQGLFIKVGQLISIMTNVLPESYRQELEKLQDKITPRPYSEITKRIRLEFGSPPEELFQEFDRRAIASASLGQVHRAVLKTGEEVAVKVQHWAIERIVRKDLKVIRRIMKIIQFFFPIQGLDEYYEQIRTMIAEELDFSMEAENIRRISRNFEGSATVHFPKVYGEYSTSKVLTTSFVHGFKITDLASLGKANVNRGLLAKLVVTTYCQMIFVDGIYHADPHPGNILVHEDGSITFLDFGAVASLSTNMKEGIPEFLEGLIRRNTMQIMRALGRMGFIARTGSEETSELIIEYFHRRFAEEIKIESLNLKDVKINPEMGIESLLDLRKMNIGIREMTSSFRIPKDWVLLERCLLLLFGLVYYLDSALNPTSIIYPYLKDFVLGSDRDWRTIIIDSLKEAAFSYLTLPEDMRRMMSKIKRGEIRFQIQGAGEREKYAHSRGRQYVYTAFALTTWGTAMYFHSQDMLISAGVSAAFTLMFLGLLAASSIYGRRFRKHL